jgi:hypothetical protein
MRADPKPPREKRLLVDMDGTVDREEPSLSPCAVKGDSVQGPHVLAFSRQKEAQLSPD